MTDDQSSITQVYRLAVLDEWAAAQETGFIPKRDIDVKDGYFHLSTESQVLETANLHFADAEDLLALEVPMAGISDAVKFELAPKRGEAFPHYYGDLKTAHVAHAIRLRRTSTGFEFGDAL